MPQAAYVRCNCTHVNPPWILNKNKLHQPHSITHFLICKTAAFIQFPEIRRLFASKCYSLFSWYTYHHSPFNGSLLHQYSIISQGQGNGSRCGNGNPIIIFSPPLFFKLLNLLSAYYNPSLVRHLLTSFIFSYL